jgi:anti-sigma regulatory factor (Ser/Thr protein kinase)
MGDGPAALGISGRGFWLIRRPFDAVSYNLKGNRLTLVKRKKPA